MSYDFRIDHNGELSEDFASFGGYNHKEIMDRVKEKHLKIFLRFEDYYVESQVLPQEMEDFISELELLLKENYKQEGTKNNLIKLKEIVIKAKAGNKSIISLPD